MGYLVNEYVSCMEESSSISNLQNNYLYQTAMNYQLLILKEREESEIQNPK